MRSLECLVSPDGSLFTHDRAAQVEIVVPVRDEERDLGPSIRRLAAYLSTRFPFRAVVTIADNGSTDRTWAVARALAAEFDAVRTVHLDQSGRGRALRSVWSASDADVLAYMDVDLSTDLNALLPLVAPLLSGHSDLAIGTRLARGARVVRGPRREVISRCYNMLLHATLGAGFSDAQCGFKAIRADKARLLLPLTRDTGWFFDSELLVLAERAGLRIHEVPVDWVDDPDSRVKVVATALADLRGIARLRWGLSRGTIRVPRLGGRVPPGRPGPADCTGSSPGSWPSGWPARSPTSCCTSACTRGCRRNWPTPSACWRRRCSTPRSTAGSPSASGAARTWRGTRRRGCWRSGPGWP